jgi:DNA invertase Pin-like site-specific DNA recombinase
MPVTVRHAFCDLGRLPAVAQHQLEPQAPQASRFMIRERPGLLALLAEVKAGRVNTMVVYKVDRLTRSLADFAKIVEIFDAHGASFVAVTQQFNTTTSMGRLTLNILLSFAQFEREVAASKRRGMWMGGGRRWPTTWSTAS